MPSSRTTPPAPYWERRNAVLLTLALALGYGAFALIAFAEDLPLRGRLALGTGLLSLGLSVLAWRQVTLSVLYPLILGLITGLVWTSLVVLSLTGQAIPSSVLSSCGLVTGLAFTWYPFPVALRWTLAACLPMLAVGLWTPYSDPPALVVGAMVLLLIVYITHYNHRLIRAQEKSQALEKLAIRDPLTGLYNRRVPLEQLEEILRRSVVPEDIAVVVMDLDHFKRINDTLGHTRGDDVLVTVAAALTQALPTGTVLCRWGGEEFLAILYGQRQEDAQDVLASTLQRLRQRTDVEGVTLSAGGAMLTEAATVRNLIALADNRLYAAKAAGRNQACWAGWALHPASRAAPQKA